VIGLCAFLVLWYGVGHVYNRRRGRRLFRQLRVGLDVLGGEVEAGWIGSPAQGARINVIHAASPFRRLELTLLLARREVPLLWLLDSLRGKGDGLIIKATLRTARRGEIVIHPAERGLFGFSAGPRQPDGPQPWFREQGPHHLLIAHQGPGAQGQVAGLTSWLKAYGVYLRRFSWQKRDPHIQLDVNVGWLDAGDCQMFMTRLMAAFTSQPNQDA